MTAHIARPATDVATLPELSAATPLPAGVSGATVLPDRIGIVHLGWGAFHRAHQAVFTQDAMSATGDRRWGILGAVRRPGPVTEAFRRQRRYAVLTVAGNPGNAEQAALRVIGAVVDVADLATETPRLLHALAAPTTHVVTLTITEKGYCRRPDGHLDHDQVAADLGALAAENAAPGDPVPAATPVGLLVRGLAARHRAGGTPVTVLSCDNLPHNGAVLRAVVEEFVAAARPGPDGDALRAWLRSSVTFPGSMVDRITPATTDDVRERVARALGARDAATVAAEPFSQWVIEDDFAGPRPAWELAGAEFVADVSAWENAKLRMLNGTHSVLAYAGRLAGHRTLAATVTDPAIAGPVRTFLFDDVLPTVTPPPDADLRAYGETLLDRFANPATGHTTQQVSTDGTQKIPVRWGPTAQAALDAGRVPQGLAYGLAAWTEFVRRTVRDGGDLGDPAGAAALTATVRRAGPADPAAVAAALLATPGLLPDGVGTDPRLVAAVSAAAGRWAATDHSSHPERTARS